MAAGGFKEFVAGEVLDEDEINDFLMQGVLVFAGTAARGSAITSPVEGQFAFLKDSDSLTYYSGTAWEELSSGFPLFDFLVIGGGGSSRSFRGGGGGAGGYRTSAGTSGGSATAEPQLPVPPGSYTVTVGAGGAAGAFGSTSQALWIQSVGGAVGGSYERPGSLGGSGSGGGGGAGSTFGPGVPRQGSDGGNGLAQDFVMPAGGGGGAGAAGANAASNAPGAGGAGLANSITGTSVTRGGGGGGGAEGGSGGSGGSGGGGNGAGGSGTPTAGTVNTGGGGGGSSNSVAGGAGGSGLVVLKYPNTITLTIGGGLTSSTVTSGDFKITTFTAGTDTVTVP